MLIGDIVILPHFIVQVLDLVVNVFNFGDETTTLIMKRKLFEMNDLAVQVDFPLENGVRFSLRQENQCNF